MRRLSGLLLCGLFALGTAHAQADDLAPLARAVDEHPDDQAAYDAFAQTAFKLKRWDDAIARLKLGVARIPSYHAGYYKLGYAYRQTKSFGEAATAYRRYAELEPTKSDPYFGLAAALQGAGDRAGAVAAYRKYVELEASPDKAKFVEQAKAEIVRLDVPDAGTKPAPAPAPTPPTVPAPAPNPKKPVPPPTMPKPTPETRPEPVPPLVAPPAPDATTLRSQADRLHQQGRLDEASAAYERALAADPGNLDLHIDLGDNYVQQHRYADAARVFRAAVTRDPGYALGWYDLAHAESRAGHHAESIAAYRTYIKLRPSDPDPFYGLAQTYEASHDDKHAAEALRTYLEMEKRPESQRWVDKARRQLQAIESPHADLRDLKNPFSDETVYALADETIPPSAEALQRMNHLRIERELVADNILPISEDDAPAPIADASRERLARYASALAAYRVALDRYADDVATVYQRGAERVIANDLRGAQRAWLASASDRAVADAKLKLDRARAALTDAKVSATTPAHARAAE